MTDLTLLPPGRSATSQRSSREIEALVTEVAKCLQLVVPASMTQDDRKAWLLAAVDALDDIRPLEITAISAELRRSVTRPSQIVPEIARLVGEKRKAKQPHRPPSPHSIELSLDDEYRHKLGSARTPQEREDAWAEHRAARIEAGLPVPAIPKPLSQKELDHLPTSLRSMGLKAGFLEYRDGKLREVVR